MNDKPSEIVGYIIGDDERITEEYHECIESCLDSMPAKSMPKFITITAYERAVPSFKDVGFPLEEILEKLDANFGDPEGYGDDQGRDDLKIMKDAETVFLKVIEKHYYSWKCKPIAGSQEEVDCEAWIREHRPNWMDGGLVFVGQNEE